MTYYPTLKEDLTRAKELLAKGKPAHEEVAYLPEPMRQAALSGGTVYGADVYVAYKLIESFVAEIERLQTILREVRRELEAAPAVRLLDGEFYRTFSDELREKLFELGWNE